MYLETILLLKEKKEDLHAVDVVTELGYAKSSVSRGINLLVKKGYIVIDGNDHILFTEEGRKKAEGIIERHRVITELLEELGANHELAEANACRIEHVISDELFEVLKSRKK